MTSIDPSSLDTLQLQLYPDNNGYIEPYEHYQDNGEDFAYQQGEYNLYRFDSSIENKKVFAKDYLLYNGYQHTYRLIVAILHKNNEY